MSDPEETQPFAPLTQMLAVKWVGDLIRDEDDPRAQVTSEQVIAYIERITRPVSNDQLAAYVKEITRGPFELDSEGVQLEVSTRHRWWGPLAGWRRRRGQRRLGRIVRNRRESQ